MKADLLDVEQLCILIKDLGKKAQITWKSAERISYTVTIDGIDHEDVEISVNYMPISQLNFASTVKIQNFTYNLSKSDCESVIKSIEIAKINESNRLLRKLKINK